MASLFLDTNIFIDIGESRESELHSRLDGNELFVSVLSIANWIYIYKHTVPSSKYSQLFEKFNLIDMTEDLVSKSLIGPTADFEDNVQLHSASEAECILFLTKDEELLKLGYFGNVRILDSLPV